MMAGDGPALNTVYEWGIVCAHIRKVVTVINLQMDNLDLDQMVKLYFMKTYEAFDATPD